MTTSQHTAERAAAEMYAADRASQGLGMTIDEVAPGFARLTMSVRADMTNGHGICHGGFIFAVADSAFAFACNSHGRPTVAAGVSVDFIAPARAGEVLTAVARERWRGRRTGVYDIEVTRADGAAIAYMRGRAHQLGATRDASKGKE
jgi:acyl-CoA thioesterase